MRIGTAMFPSTFVVLIEDSGKSLSDMVSGEHRDYRQLEFKHQRSGEEVENERLYDYLNVARIYVGGAHSVARIVLCGKIILSRLRR